MLSKPIGGTGFYSLSSTTGTVSLSSITGGTTTPRKVRVAVSSQPAVINFGTKVANNNSDILMPAGHVEHFSIEATNTMTFVLAAGGSTGGYISITAVA